jgi:hypothetical protein
MTTIDQLNSIDTPSGSDLLPIYSFQNGNARKLSISNFVAYILSSFASPTYQTQYSIPGATGFTIAVNNTSSNTWLVINPASAYATGAITLPDVAKCVDGQELIVNCSQQITTFTVNGGGAIAVNGAPTSLAADDFFRLRFQKQTQSWYRVG